MKRILLTLLITICLALPAYAANDTDTNVKYFDTTSGASVTGIIKIIAIYWTSDGGTNLDIAADDDFLLSDANGHRIIGKRAEAIGDDLGIVFPQPLVSNGITVTTMDGGVCYVFVQ